MKKKLLYSAVIACMGLSPFMAQAQQDPQYSLYMFDKMALNPAAAGTKGLMEANLIARDQWVDIQGAPRTVALTLQAPFSNQKNGWGAQIMNDQLGPTTTTTIQGDYSYRIHLLKGQLSMGLGFGVSDYVIDFSKINYKDQSDPYNTLNRSQKIVPTAEFGLYYYSHSFYAGVSLNHLIQSRLTNESYDSAASFKPHIYVIVGQGFQISPNVVLNPSLTIKLAQYAPPTADINVNVLLQEKLWFGVSYRSQYGLTFLAAYRISQMFQFGYAYDLGLNGIGTVGGGAHEISLIVNFGGKTTQASPRYL